MHPLIFITVSHDRLAYVALIQEQQRTQLKSFLKQELHSEILAIQRVGERAGLSNMHTVGDTANGVLRPIPDGQEQVDTCVKCFALFRMYLHQLGSSFGSWRCTQACFEHR